MGDEQPPFEQPPVEQPPSEQPPVEQPPSEEPPAEQPPSEQPPAEQPPAEQPPSEQPPAEQPPAEQPPAEQPPAEQPPSEQPPAEKPPAEQPSAEQPPAEQPSAEQPAGDATRKPSIKRESRITVDTKKDAGDSRKKSVVVERSASVRGSVRQETSKERMIRRQSERSSKSKMALGSLISFGRRGTYGTDGGGAKVPRFMNTYKLDSDKPFHIEKVEKILKQVLTEALENLTYDPEECPKQAKLAANMIRARVKEEEYDRYKLVVMVTIGEKRYHDMCSVVRFLWDIERDKYALFVHDNMYVFGSALCFGVYYE